eukprot:TRINITY_DN101461_c0_g1_i1.p1 TRINITY_DN101461_c0_g1~~TRINITY_DN101461_c0_g1_i1.p1  ORF type:complete len:321 (+),score=47.82 TRINITY_DN101461_c0_g1_i1:133-1095(+)
MADGRGAFERLPQSDPYALAVHGQHPAAIGQHAQQPGYYKHPDPPPINAGKCLCGIFVAFLIGILLGTGLLVCRDFVHLVTHMGKDASSPSAPEPPPLPVPAAATASLGPGMLPSPQNRTEPPPGTSPAAATPGVAKQTLPPTLGSAVTNASTNSAKPSAASHPAAKVGEAQPAATTPAPTALLSNEFPDVKPGQFALIGGVLWQSTEPAAWDCTLCPLREIPSSRWGTEMAIDGRVICSQECARLGDGCEAFLYPAPGEGTVVCVLLGKTGCAPGGAPHFGKFVQESVQVAKSLGQACGHDPTVWDYYSAIRDAGPGNK